MKIVIQGKGSEKDPAFADQVIVTASGKVPFLTYFHENGISTLPEDLVVSCHGYTALALERAEQFRQLAEHHHVVGIFAGGLYFALPSIIAANAPTVPIISVPLANGETKGLDALLAPMLPTGTAAIGGVGIGNYASAARIAKAILCNEHEGIYLFQSPKKYAAPEQVAKLEKALAGFNIPVLGETSGEYVNGVVLATFTVDHDTLERLDASGNALIYAPVMSNSTPEILAEIDSLPKSELVTGFGRVIAYLAESSEHVLNLVELSETLSQLEQTLFVRGPENAAIMAAKAMTLRANPGIAERLVAMREEKAATYQRAPITAKQFVR